MRQQVRSMQYSMQHSVLCLFQVGLTVPVGRGVERTRTSRDAGTYLEAVRGWI
jgi:hypothetical protein